MAERTPKRMVAGEVERATEQEVVVRKQACHIGHSFIRRLWDYVDANPGLDLDFGLQSVYSELARYSQHAFGYPRGDSVGLCPGFLSGCCRDQCHGQRPGWL